MEGNLLLIGPAGLAGCQAGTAGPGPDPDRAGGRIGPTLGRGKIPDPEPTGNTEADPALGFTGGFTGGPALLPTKLPAGPWLGGAVGWLLFFEWFPG